MTWIKTKETDLKAKTIHGKRKDKGHSGKIPRGARPVRVLIRQIPKDEMARLLVELHAKRRRRSEAPHPIFEGTRQVT